MAQRSERQHRRRTTSAPRRSGEAYVDTSAFIAFLDKSDSFHPLFKRLFAQPPSLVTSALVVAEGHGWFLRRHDRYRAMQFLAFLDTLPSLKIVPSDADELAGSRELLARFDNQNLTLADAHALIVMKQRGVQICWSTDRHLSLTGVRLASAA